MSRTIGRFDFRIYGGGKPKPGKLSISPIVVLVLKRWTTSNGAPAISPELVTDGEIDEHISALKADLDAIAKAAKAALKKARSN
jgi:hypothetical protein